MKRPHKAKPKRYIAIAKERIAELIKQAELVFNENPKLSNRYVAIARKISMKYKVKFTPSQKKRFCKSCYAFLVPSKSCTVRIRQGKLIYRCKSCKAIMRFPYKITTSK